MTQSGLLSVLHPVVVTRDMERALAFYRDLVGFSVKSEMRHDAAKLARLGGPANARAWAVVLTALDGSELEIATFEAPEGKSQSDAAWPDAGIRSVTFVVSDIDRMVSRLSKAGYHAVGEVVPFEVEGANVRVAYVHGPDGVILTFLEYGGV